MQICLLETTFVPTNCFLLMRHLFTLLFLALTLPLTAQDLKTFVQDQLAAYPASRLLDIYKSCFQDYMGAEHLVADPAGVAKYLDYELQQIGDEERQSEYYEACGPGGRFVRVSLLAVKDGKIDRDSLLDAFVRSAKVERPSLVSWQDTWKQYLLTIDSLELQLLHYTEDRAFIDSVLQTGHYAISHSQEYRQAYHPHYRIIERGIFEREIKPRL